MSVHGWAAAEVGEAVERRCGIKSPQHRETRVVHLADQLPDLCARFANLP
jgi:hypothetical protein